MLDGSVRPAVGDESSVPEQPASAKLNASAAASADATSPSRRLGLGAVNALAPRSGVGALAVVGLLLLATAALASGLAHGDLLVDRSTSVSGAQPDGEIRARNRSVSTTTRVTSPEATTLPSEVCRAATVNRCSRPSTYAVVARHLDLGADRAGGEVLELDPGADRRLALGEGRLDLGAGGRLAPREQPRRAEDGEAAGADRDRGVVVGDRERQGGHASSSRKASSSTPGSGSQSRSGQRREAEPLVEPVRGDPSAGCSRAPPRRRPPRGTGRCTCRASASPTPWPWACGATASIRNSPSSANADLTPR